MRMTRQKKNTFGGNDFFYSIKCDVCGSSLKMPAKKNKPEEEMAFRTCGEEKLSALARGWIVEGNTAICDCCLKTLGE